MNSYLLESDDYVLLEEERKKILEKEKFSSQEISYYDMEETSLSKALEDLDTYNFLSEKKTVIIKNIDNLKYDENKDDFEHLFKYINNPQPDNLLIIEAKKLNNTLKVTKTLKKICKYVSIEPNTKSYIKNELKDYKISQETINLIDEYCQNDITKIKSECNKLKIYKIEEKTITTEDVKLLVEKKLNNSQELTFKFARNIAERDIKKALEKYNKLLEYNIEPLSIIGLLASQLRIIYQVKILIERNMNDKDIARTLGEKEFRIKKTRELVPLYTEKEILSLMQRLANIDLKIKTTDTNPKTEIELFILNI